MEGGGGTFSEIHQTARKLLLRTRDGLERLERLEYSNSSSSSDLSFAVSKDITQIQSLCVEMSQLSRSIGAKSQRDLWNRKVEQIAEEAESLRESLEKYNSRNHKRMMEAKEREELLGRVNGDPSHVLKIFDDDTQAMLSVRNSARELENANALGETILSSIHGQRERLKSAHRKALDVLNTAGISNRVLRLIERRNRVDQWIKYAGMILTVIFLFAFALWRR
uniref:Membrin n=1 Tax=Medicago truncatula TaxID=3880 RepID=B7FH92_MEDTR|nr:unknown [Medicago truncatula]AFK45862.1 unknown [Medicago truncatula]